VTIAFTKGKHPFLHKPGYHTKATSSVTCHLYKWSK
jgi:hypothetical protein